MYTIRRSRWCSLSGLVLTVTAAGLMLAPIIAGASHTPEWTNLNESDPGIAIAKPPAEARGEKGGTADINIGVGELWEGENETDLDTLRERARRIHDEVLGER